MAVLPPPVVLLWSASKTGCRVEDAACVGLKRKSTVGRVLPAKCVVIERTCTGSRVLGAGCVVKGCLETNGSVVASFFSESYGTKFSLTSPFVRLDHGAEFIEHANDRLVRARVKLRVNDSVDNCVQSFKP
jgi:hypothetical protein